MPKRQDFVWAVAKVCQLKASEVEDVLFGINAVVMNELLENGAVRIPGLVDLKRIPRKERVYNNPRTGEKYTLAAGHTLKASPVVSLIKDSRK